MTTASRFAAILERIAPEEGSPRLIDQQQVGRALFDFGATGVLPTRPEDIHAGAADTAAVLVARETVLDAEELLHLCLGGDPDADVCAAIDACRDGGSIAADERLRALAGGFRAGRAETVLAQLRQAISGSHVIGPVELAPAE